MRRFGDLELDAMVGWLVCGEARIAIRPALVRLLVCLIKARGRPRAADVLCGVMRISPRHPPIALRTFVICLTELRKALAAVGSRVTVANHRERGWSLVPPP